MNTHRYARGTVPLCERVLGRLAERRFEPVFGELARAGKAGPAGWVNGSCPFHEDKRPSFGFHVATGRWRCHGGCEGGDAFSFYARSRGIEGFRESLLALALTFLAVALGNLPACTLIGNPAAREVHEYVRPDGQEVRCYGPPPE